MAIAGSPSRVHLFAVQTATQDNDDTLRLEAVDSLDAIPAAAWDRLAGDDNPFVEHAFLHLLERSGSVGRGTGWQPLYLIASRAGRLVGAVPAYLKTDSYGEYVFDWAWARAAQDAGVA